jgi:hypothetical protein
MTERCTVEVPTLEAVALGGRLGLSASLGSWCILGQRHERPYVDGAKTKAKLCIYLKASLADSRLKTSPAATRAAPNGGNKLKEKTALAVPTATEAAVRSTERWGAPECAFRSSSVWGGLMEEGVEQM